MPPRFPLPSSGGLWKNQSELTDNWHQSDWANIANNKYHKYLHFDPFCPTWTCNFRDCLHDLDFIVTPCRATFVSR
jgi:hypothetical protein